MRPTEDREDPVRFRELGSFNVLGWRKGIRIRLRPGEGNLTCGFKSHPEYHYQPWWNGIHTGLRCQGRKLICGFDSRRLDLDRFATTIVK